MVVTAIGDSTYADVLQLSSQRVGFHRQGHFTRGWTELHTLLASI